MSIKFNSETKTFHLQSGTMSYVFVIDPHNYLKHLYFGEKIGDAFLVSLYPRVPRSFSANYPGVKDAQYSLDTLPNEYPTYGTGDQRNFSILIALSDGSRLTDFKYQSHQILSKKPNIEGLPSFKGKETLIVTLYDEVSKLSLELYYTTYDSSFMTRSVIVKNTANKSVKILKVSSFSIDFSDANYELLTLPGTYALERMIERANIHQGLFEISSRRGSSSHQMNPFLGLVRKNTTEFSGEAYGFSLVYSGSFSFSAEKDQFNTLRIMGGINHHDFGWHLEKGASFSTPEVAIAYSNKGINDMSQTFHDAIRSHLIDPNFAYSSRPVVLNNWEATYFNFNKEKLLDLINKASLIGVDLFVLDDGWFGQRVDDTSSLGDWIVNEEKLGGTLKELIAYTHQKGLKFGLWFEPEMISEKSLLYQTHPEFVLRHPKNNPTLSRNQYVIDMTNDKVVDYLYQSISKILKEHDIDYLKWDMNRSLTENYSLNLNSHQQSEVQHRFILGTYKLIENLKKSFPHILFEGCSGGGGRFDLGMLAYTPQIWTSDNIDPYSRLFIQYGTSLVYPLSTSASHVGVSPSNSALRKSSFKTRGLVASLGPTGYEFDLTKLTDDDLHVLKEQIKFYKEIEPLILKGDLYRLSNPFETDLFAFLVLDKNKNNGYFVAVNGTAKINPPLQNIKLIGLDENKTYKVKELNRTFSGKNLINIGLPINIFTTDYDSVAYRIEKI